MGLEPWWRSAAPYADGDPGTYALVIGVSRYDNLPPGGEPGSEPWSMGLSQLDCAALGAAQFADWIQNTHRLPDAPLRSIWLLLSPSDAETAKLTPDQRNAPAALTTNVLSALGAWRSACRRNSANVALLYAAGHGIGMSRATPGVLLLQDYADDPVDALLEHALSLTKVHGNLAGSPRGAPGRQFSFFDACRPRTPLSLTLDLGDAPPLWMIPVVATAEASPMFLSAAVGTRAYGQAGQVTLFWRALKECLDAYAVDLLDDGRWGVSDDRLFAPLRKRLQMISQEFGVNQRAALVPTPAGVPLHVCPNPPSIERTFAVWPEEARQYAFATLRGSDPEPPVFEAVCLEEPYRRSVKAGTYELSVAIDPATPPFEDTRLFPFIWPRGPHQIDVPVVGAREHEAEPKVGVE
jgi:hypothetical protein